MFFNSLETEFGIDRTAISGIFSAHMLLSSAFSILGGWALDRYGPRKVAFVMGLAAGLSLVTSSLVHSLWQLYATYSLLLAVGSGSIFVIANTTTSRWFVKKRGFAVGITSSASSAGQVVMAPFATVLLTHFDWRMSFIILGLITWIILLPVSGLMKRDPADLGLLPDGVKPNPTVTKPENTKNRKNTQEEGLALSESCKTREFWLMALIWLLLSMSVNLVLTHSIPHAIDLGISPMDAALIVSLIGAGSMAGRLGFGRLSDNIGRKIPALIGATMQVALLVWLIWIKELWMFYLFAVIFGYAWGGLGAAITVIIGDVFGVRSLGVVMGAISAGWMIGAAIGPAVGGMAYDASGTYSTAFAIAASGMLITAILTILVRPGSLKSKANYGKQVAASSS